MDRLEFLKQARQIAYEQIDGFSRLPEKQFKKLLQEKNQELALWKLAKQFLENAFYDIDYNIWDMIEEGGENDE